MITYYQRKFRSLNSVFKDDQGKPDQEKVASSEKDVKKKVFQEIT